MSALLQVKDEDKGRKEEDENQNYSSAGEESREGHNKHGKQSKRGSKPPKDGDTNTYANWAVQKLRNQKPPLQVGGELVTFEPSTLQVTFSLLCHLQQQRSVQT